MSANRELFLALLVAGAQTVFSQTYGNATYSRMPVVSQFHTKEFNIDTGNVINEYMEEIIVIPYLAGVGIFLAILVFEVALCCRWCCHGCRCIVAWDTTNESVEDFAMWAESIKTSRIRLKFFFYGFFILCIIFSSTGFLTSREYYAEGGDRLLDSADDLNDLTLDLEDSGDDLAYLSEEVYNATVLAIPTCPQSEEILNYTEVYTASVAEYNDIIDPIPGNINDLRNFANTATENIEGGLISLVNIVTLVVGINMIAYCLRKRIMMRFSLGIELFLFHLNTIAWMGATVMLMVLSDFCMAPTDNAISISPNDVRDIAYYYGTCNGTNPLYDPISSAVEAVTALSLGITILTQPGGPCENNAYLNSTTVYIADMYRNISYIEDATACEPLQHEWAYIFNDAFCEYAFIGTYTLFITFTSLLVVTYCLMVTSSLVSQYFDEYWETGNHVTRHAAAMFEANLLDGVDQLQTDGSVTLSSASSESTPQIQYNSTFVVAPPTLSPFPPGVTSDSIPPPDSSAHIQYNDQTRLKSPQTIISPMASVTGSDSETSSLGLSSSRGSLYDEM